MSGFTLGDDFFHTSTHVRLNFAKDLFVFGQRCAKLSFCGPDGVRQILNIKDIVVAPLRELTRTGFTPAHGASILAYLEPLSR